MLILTRKLGESINIGENIQVKVLKVRGSQVQLGISAPPEIKVTAPGNRREGGSTVSSPEIEKRLSGILAS